MKKINKTKARNLYNKGAAITLTPCKANPRALWFHGVEVQKDHNRRDFDSLINEFEYYNCNNEMGRYAAYYIEENEEAKTMLETATTTTTTTTTKEEEKTMMTYETLIKTCADIVNKSYWDLVDDFADVEDLTAIVEEREAIDTINHYKSIAESNSEIEENIKGDEIMLNNEIFGELSEEHKAVVIALLDEIGEEPDAVRDVTVEDDDLIRVEFGGYVEYTIATDTRANELLIEEVENSAWAFNPEFIIDNNARLSELYGRERDALCQALQSMQSDMCEGCNEIMLALIDDLEDFAMEAARWDGRGHFLSRYDGEEIELPTIDNENVHIQDWYAYKN